MAAAAERRKCDIIVQDPPDVAPNPQCHDSISGNIPFFQTKREASAASMVYDCSDGPAYFDGFPHPRPYGLNL